MEVVRGYEQELSATCAEISLATGRLRLAASQAELAALAATLEGLFQDAEETVEQVELESHGLEAAARARVAARVTSYQAELRRQPGCRKLQSCNPRLQACCLPAGNF